MGYTHYWGVNDGCLGSITQEDEKRMVDIFRDILKRYASNITADITGDMKYEVRIADDGTSLQFNGWPHRESYESFRLDWRNIEDFQCCKTARRPYDVPIMEILLVYKHFFGDRVFVKSDGFCWKPDGSPLAEDIDMTSWISAAGTVERLYGISTPWLSNKENYTPCK